ncbi:MAG: hypothetical protein ACREPI_07895 [Candidatus Dormibacterales bacterium]
MRQRTLSIAGAGAIAVSPLVAVIGLAAGILGGRGGDIGMARAVQAAQSVATSYPGTDEVIEFSQNDYASIREKNAGVGAFEIPIDRAREP